MNTSSKRNFIKALNIALLFSSLTHSIESPYKLAGEYALQSEERIKKDSIELSLEQKVSLDAQKAAEAKDVRKTNLTLIPLTDFEKKEICFELFSRLPKKDFTSLVNKQAIQELHILCGEINSRKSNLMTRLQPITACGYARLAANLTQPTSDQNLIKMRQNIIKELKENQELRIEFQKALNDIKEAESYFFTFWKDQDMLSQRVADQVYFPKALASFNNDPKMLELLRTWHGFWHGLGFLPATFFGDTISAVGREGIERYRNDKSLLPLLFTWPYHIKTTLRASINNYTFTSTPGIEDDIFYPIMRLNPLMALMIPGFTSKDRYNVLRQECNISSESAIGMLAGTRALYDGVWAYRIYQAYTTLNFQSNVNHYLHTKMNYVAQLVNGLKKINELVENNAILKHNLSSTEVLDMLCTKPYRITDKTHQFMKLISTDTFKGKPTALSIRGRVLAAANLMPLIKDTFIPALEVVGELDAYVAIAENMHTFEQQPVHYCFAEFVESDLPYIALEEGWNPLINPQNAVPVTITLGHEHNHALPNVMLTGPHGCGKTATMEAIAYNVYLAHVYGIGFATSLKLSPFTKMLIYIDIKQNREEGMSTFMAEAYKVDEIEHEIAVLKPTDCCFTIMDEVFKGTMQEEGAKRLYQFGAKVIQIPQNICIFATHFKQPTLLEQETNGKIVNYHVGLEEPQEGNFIPTYTLVPGVNTWWFEDIQKRERYIDWLRRHNNLHKQEVAQAA